MKRIATLFACCALLASCKSNDVINVIPEPNQVCLHGNKTLCIEGAAVSADPSFDELSQNYIAAFAQDIPACEGAGSKIDFVLNSKLGKEAYVINVCGKGVKVEASTLNGVVYAVQTIRQLGWNLPYVTIKDEPRFAYRGLHLDPCRHFWSIEETKRYIDVMEMHKLNTLHWHLTEDQGWRVEIKAYPRLTEVGSKRAQTVIGRTNQYDGTPYGGYYTQEEVKDVIAYAAARGITIIPEVDLPGHMQAALAAYPELGCTGGPYKVWERWGVSEDVLCVGKPEVMEFLDTVVGELCDLFPGEYFHIGGDECPKVRWHDCPVCRAKMAELGLTDTDQAKAEDYLQCYVTKHMEDFLATKGRKMIGWDEILEGELSPNATVMSWRGVTGGIKASSMGHDVIMTPNTYCYFDYCQSKNYKAEPISIGGFVPAYGVYSFDPCQDMTPEQASHILGVQANMWTEYIAEPWHLEYMLLPRVAALSEVQWCQLSRKDWVRFRENAKELCKTYEAKGWNYAKHIFEPGYGESANQKTVKNLAQGKPATSATEPHLSYTLHCPVDLFDSVVGENYFTSGQWVGYNGSPMDVTVKMGSTKFSSITINTLVGKQDWIFNLTWYRISTSSDGQNFTVVAEQTFPADGPSDPDDIRKYRIDMPDGLTKAKYVRIEADCPQSIPEWHVGAGKVAFLFVDEIIFE